MSKKILSIILAVLMLCSLVVTPALADDYEDAVASGWTPADGARGVTEQESTVYFEDAVGNWAEAYINRWASVGVINGDDQGHINPQKSITRAEMAKIIVNLTGLSDKGDASFDDVVGNEWYTDAVLACANAGIMLGDGVNCRPKDPVTRQEAIVLIARALGVKAVDDPDLTEFEDGEEVASWAAGYIAALVDKGIVNGMSTTSAIVAPGDNINRSATFALLGKAITTYITEAGEYSVDDANGYVVINLPADETGKVIVTGTAAGVVITAGTAEAEVTAKDLTAEVVKVDGTASVALEGKTEVDTVEINDEAEVTVGKDAKVSSVEANAAAAIENNGKVGTLNTNADGVTVDGKGTIDAVETAEGVKPATDPKGNEVEATPEKETKPTTSTGGSSSGGSSGGYNPPAPTTPPAVTDADVDKVNLVDKSGTVTDIVKNYKVTTDKKSDTLTEVTISGSALKQHNNGSATNYWIGFSVKAPSDATSYKYGAGTSASITASTPSELDWNINGAAPEGSEGVKGAAIYLAVGTTTSNYFAIQWQGSADTATHIYKVTLDVSRDINHTVTFNSNGGSDVGSKTVADNSTTTAPTAPTKTGYTFGGWYKESGCTNEWNFTADKVTADVTLYAKWTANTYTVAFDANGGEGVMANQTMTYDQSAALTTNTFTKTGYTFSGWATTANGAVAHADGASVSNLASDNNATVTLYAVWTANMHTVTINVTGGDLGTVTVTASSDSISSGASVAYGTSVTVTVTVADAETNEVKTLKYNDGTDHTITSGTAFTMPDADITITVEIGAKTSTPPTTYTVTCAESTNGSVSASPTTAAEGATVTLTVTPDAGYELDELTVATASTTKVSDTTYTFTMPAASVTITATFKLTQHTVTVADVTGATVTVKNGAATVTSGSKVNYNTTLTIEVEVTDNTKQLKSIKVGLTDITSTKQVTVTADITITVELEDKAVTNYTVSFDLNGATGTAPEAQSVAAGGKANEPNPAPTRTGYTFGGWFTSATPAEGDTAYDFNTAVSANVILYAKWAANTYTVTFVAGDGATCATASKEVTFGSAYGELPTPFKEAHTFAGWFTTAEGGTQVTEETTVNTASDHTLYAHWTPASSGEPGNEPGGER